MGRGRTGFAISTPLSRRFRVCVADLLGYGDSSAPTSPTLGAGHWVQYEAAEQVNQLLASWFASQGSSTAR
jgi:pimeloyl-ACP methyl ester carboxylesterase